MRLTVTLQSLEVIDVTTDPLQSLATDIRACEACVASLPLGPRPVLQVGTRARLTIAAQAPGLKVHQTGVPFNDPSGDRLRDWMGVDRDTFYDAGRINIVPMGFCYPGRNPSGGDLPPRPECRRLWHDRLLACLPGQRLTLVIGQYAQAYHLKARREASLTATVLAWRAYLPSHLPLPHPSPRNNGWLKRNPWFEAELVPELRALVRQTLQTEPA